MSSDTLTQKQESFCLAYIECGNASEAYRRSYNAEKMKPESVHRMANDVMNNLKVASRIEELRAIAAKKAVLTLESHLTRLESLSRAAESTNQFSAAITAEIARGKASGLYVEKTEVSGPNGGPVAIERIERVVVDPK